VTETEIPSHGVFTWNPRQIERNNTTLFGNKCPQKFLGAVMHPVCSVTGMDGVVGISEVCSAAAAPFTAFLQQNGKIKYFLLLRPQNPFEICGDCNSAKRAYTPDFQL